MPNVCEGSYGSTREIGGGEKVSLEIVDSFHYLGNVISCRGGVELAVRDRISCAWSKWKELVSLLLNHSIPLEERVKVYCAWCEACIAVCCGNLGTNGRTGRTAS